MKTVTIVAVALTLNLIGPVATAQQPKQPGPSTPDISIPEQILPKEKGIPSPPATGGRARDESDNKLNGSDGVILPLPDIDPGLRVPAPVPDPDTTIVIPPLGSPGNPSPDLAK